MPLFHHENRQRTAETRRLYALFEVIYTLVDFAAALCFISGSVMFFSEAWKTPGTWLFLVGSLLFATKPTLRLAREIRLAAAGDRDTLAERFPK